MRPSTCHRERAPSSLGAFAGLAAFVACGGSDRQGPRPTPTAGAPEPPHGSTSYVLVRATGATAFATPPAQPVGAQGTHLGRGFGFMVDGERTVGGRRYVQVHDGRWLPASEVSPITPSAFAGVKLDPGDDLRFGWVVAPAATIHASSDTAGASATVLGTRPYHSRILLAGRCRADACPLAAGWVRRSELAIPARAPRPADVGPRDPWLDVDLASQTLVAYLGDEPRFATLVSTGFAPAGSPLATPTGVFRIRSKHAVVRMDNLGHTGVEPYAYDVPLTQYFSDGKALHAAPWHDRFGHARSHGCINLSPRDASWLFTFTSPNLLPGATEIQSTTARPGTVLRVRGTLPADGSRAGDIPSP